MVALALAEETTAAPGWHREQPVAAWHMGARAAPAPGGVAAERSTSPGIGGAGLTEGPGPGSPAGADGGRGSPGGSPSESGVEPALKPWPSPNQEAGQETGDSGGGGSLANGTGGAGSRRGSPSSRTGPRGAGGAQKQAIDLLPQFEPAGGGSENPDPVNLPGGLSTTAAGALGQNSLSMLNGIPSTLPGSRGSGSAPEETGTAAAGIGDLDPHQTSSTGGRDPRLGLKSAIARIEANRELGLGHQFERPRSERKCRDGQCIWHKRESPDHRRPGFPVRLARFQLEFELDECGRRSDGFKHALHGGQLLPAKHWSLRSGIRG